MPSSLHPQAKFDPLPPDLDLSVLVEKTQNFDYVIRISVDQITSPREFEHLVLVHVIIGGRPLVIEGWNNKLPPWLFSADWLQDNVGRKEESVRDIPNGTNIPMTIGHYLKSLDKLTNQWSPSNFRDSRRQRLYLKDIDCPDAWYQHLQGFIPPTLFYLNDCVGDKGGPGALHERNMYNQLVLGKGIAPAGDLMSNLPEEMRAQNMMCYIGHEGTYTPAHREMCASLGQNIMVETSTTAGGEKPGTSIWFMTESKDREVVSEYFLSMLGHDIEVENHFAQINAWKKAPFPVYIVEQNVGDFILIPPLAPHQVWNRGTRTMKAAWNRTTVETLELAIHEALPRARMVCRDEQYKNKAIIYFSLLRYFDQLKRVDQAEEGGLQGYATEPIRNSTRVKQLQKDFKRLFVLYCEILVTEMFSPGLPKEKQVEFIPFDGNITCSYCRCNIFNRFLTCKTCVGELDGSGEEDTYDICMECFAMGRSCTCISNLKWVEQWQWPVLTQRYEQWRAMVISNDQFVDVDSSPRPLEVARTRYGKKPVAQVCQEQLKLRPWRDPSKVDSKEVSPRAMDLDSEPEVDDEGRVKKKKAGRRKSVQQGKQSTACHICQHQEWNWKLAFCTTCTNAYCYGSLWRAFDLKPQTIMEVADWECPRCQKICSCGRCRKDSGQNPYRPKGTLLGHDTRKVADPRSVESLVDFRRTNLTWLRGEGDDDPQSSQRMKILVQKAQEQKARDEILEEEIAATGNGMQKYSPESEQMGHLAIDPLLCGSGLFNIEENHSSLRVHTNGSLSGRDPAHGEGDFHTSIDPGLDYDDDRENHSAIGGYVAPPARTLSPGSTYPDPSGLGRDRMMGVGYYQQANDIDKILFDDLDATTPTGANSSFIYPALPQEDRYHVNSKKRKLDGLSVNGTQDEAHIQYALALKKQKLVQAKRDGIYIMTKNKLEGGGPLTIKLPMKNSIDFLRRLEELDGAIGRENVRWNPIPPRPRVLRRSEIDENRVMVTSDVQQNRVVESIYREFSDVEDDVDFGMFVPDMNQAPKKQSVNTKAHTDKQLSGNTRKFASPAMPQAKLVVANEEMDVDKVIPGKVPSRPLPEARRPNNQADAEPSVGPGKARHPQKPLLFEGKTDTLTPRKQGRPPRARVSGGQVEDASERRERDRLPNTYVSRAQVDDEPSEISRRSGRPPKIHPAAPKPVDQRSTKQVSRKLPMPRSPVVEKPSRGRLSAISIPRDDSAKSENFTAALSSLDHPTKGMQDSVVSSPSNTTDEPTPQADIPGKTKASQATISFDDSISDSSSSGSQSDTAFLADKNFVPALSNIDPEYQNAKMEALRRIEAEAENREKSKNNKGGNTPHRAVPIIIDGPLGSIIPGSLANHPPGKLLSLADRRALRGKTTKINSNKKPSASQCPVTSAVKTSTPSQSSTTNSSRKFSVGPSRSFSRPYSEDSSSSDDSDASDSIPAIRPPATNPPTEPAGLLDGPHKAKSRFGGVK